MEVKHRRQTVEKEVKKTGLGDKKIDKEERKKKNEETRKNSGCAISREAYVMCAPPIAGISSEEKSLVENERQRKPFNFHDDISDVILISDSDDDEDFEYALGGENLCEHNVKLLAEHLAEMISLRWKKYRLEEQVRQCKEDVKTELKRLEKTGLGVCEDVQRTAYIIDNNLYDSLPGYSHELPELEIMDTEVSKPGQLVGTVKTAHVGRKSSQYDDVSVPKKEPGTRRLSDVATDTETHHSTRKRKCSSHCSLKEEDKFPVDNKEPVLASVPAPDGKRVLRKSIEMVDIKVLELERETEPADLPPSGKLVRTELRVGDLVYAVWESTFGNWLQARVLEVWPKGSELSRGKPCVFTNCKVHFKHKLKGTSVKQVTGRQLAYPEPANIRLPIGTRVIAIFNDPDNCYKKEFYYPGVVAEMPNSINSYRYLVFFDEGCVQYVTHAHMLVVYECSALVWEDIHPNTQDFVRKYLTAYPEWPMVRLQSGHALKTEYKGSWWPSHVLAVDASLIQVRFDKDGSVEWIYSGSPRLDSLFVELQVAEKQRPCGLTSTTKAAIETVAEKAVSVTPPPRTPTSGPDPLLANVLSRVVYYSPKAVIKPNKMVAHMCSLACQRSNVLPLHKLRTSNPLVRPLLVGWERLIHRFMGKKVTLYRAPCGRRLRDLPELHRYLQAVQSDMSVDLFDFHPEVQCMAEFVLGKCYVSKEDLSQGMENVPVPCVNYYDTSLPECCTYSTTRTPTNGVPLNLDPEFLCGCDCTDDCQDKSKCQCWKLTIEGAAMIGLQGARVGYHYKRLRKCLPSGIYECNSRCKCAMTCLNRVVQHPLQLKLQVYKTSNRGWGIRTLNDVPRGAFLFLYAANLLTDADANKDGISERDEYLAELDYIEVVERMKEDYESDVRDDSETAMMKLPPEEYEESEEEVTTRKQTGYEADVDFRPMIYMVGKQTAKTGMRLRKQTHKEKCDQQSDSATDTWAAEEEKKEKRKEKRKEKMKKIDPDAHFLKSSDGEEVWEPSGYISQASFEYDFRPKRRMRLRKRSQKKKSNEDSDSLTEIATATTEEEKEKEKKKTRVIDLDDHIITVSGHEEVWEPSSFAAQAGSEDEEDDEFVPKRSISFRTRSLQIFDEDSDSSAETAVAGPGRGNEKEKEEWNVKPDDRFLTTSDHKEVWEPSRFAAQAGWEDEEDKDFAPKRSMRLKKRTLEMFDEDSDSSTETGMTWMEKDKDKEKEKTRDVHPEDHFITNSDHEKVWEPSSFAAQAGSKDGEDDEFVPKRSMSLRNRTRKLFDEDSDSSPETAMVGTEKENENDKNVDLEENFFTTRGHKEVPEPSSFSAQAGMEDDEGVPKHRSVRSFFGEDETCYIMNAKAQGNLGRYLNHSCCPNVFVQNVFVDTHDPRFPWIAFFALKHVSAGTELTWNYNYKVGSVPNRSFHCACGAPNCTGRLL